MKISELPLESLQYMHTNPVFIMTQHERHRSLKQIGDQIVEISNHFSLYADLGLKMCNEFKCLRQSFDSMDLLSDDESIKPLKDIFAVVDETFSTHFNIIYNNIANPLNTLVNKDLVNLDSIEKDYQKNLQNYTETEEKYASMKPKTKGKEKTEKEQSMMRDHTLASLSFFEFSKKMEEVELKLKALLPQMFMSYLTSVTKPFSECMTKINDKQELLQSTQEKIDQINNKVQEFSKYSIQVKQQLSSQIPIFWGRLTVPYEINKSTKLQGILRRRNNLKGWHKEYFSLSDGLLSYSKYVDGIVKRPKSVPVILCSVKPEPSMPRNNCFSISINNSSNVPKKTIVLQALTHWDMSNWLSVIQNSIFNQTNIGGDEDENENTGIVNVCADCRSNHCPWCSINFCVPLCSKCVAEHRFIGANYSKVRSLKLDTIDPYQRALIEAIGTENANKILEKNIGSLKIDLFSSTDERRDFIIRKYQKLEFTQSNDSVDIISAIEDQNLLKVYEYLTSKHKDYLDNFLPIHAAACIGNPLVLHLICLNTNKIDALDDSGWSALSYATYFEQILMIEILLSYGADPNASTEAHPYCIARYLENSDLIKIFEKYKNRANYSEDMTFSSPCLYISPSEFKFEKYVANPQVYLNAKSKETKN